MAFSADHLPRPITLYRHGAWQQLTDIVPTRTVLQWLREDCGETGTKEGCAEGDCGACTVVVSRKHGNEIAHEAINSCIAFVPSLDGAALTTVEDLADADHTPHPAQQAMVDCHASQCGFCTPGFVMSLYAEYVNAKSSVPPSRTAINDALSGNLCRCTGYRPIVEAAQTMRELQESTAQTARRAALEAALQAAPLRSPLVLDTSQGRWFAPHTLADLTRALHHHPQARVVAGTTDVGLWVTKQLREFDALVSVNEVRELRVLKTTKRGLTLGAAVTWSEAMPALINHAPTLAELLRRFASPLIRNRATVGGNLANGSPIGDGMPALIALGATVELARWSATLQLVQSRTLPLEALYLAYQKTALQTSEVIASVQIPPVNATTLVRSYKISKRFDQDISAVCLGLAVDVRNGRIHSARVAFGGMAAIPKRASHCEAALLGKSFTPDTIDTAKAALVADFQPMSDMRASAAYRMTVAQNLLARFYVEATTGQTLSLADAAAQEQT